uniref:thymidine kinase n=1 Tax=viral metagenome TaxID=1070528 RepID=A0A6C0AFE2_9ZZZZ
MFKKIWSCIGIEKWLNLNKLIYISGLDSDYISNPFKELSTIYHITEDIIKLKAI